MPWSLSAQQEDFEKRLRTVSLGMCAIGVLVYLLILLRQAILPLLLALALKHLLEPLVELLSVRPIVCCGRAFLGKPSTCKQQLQRGHRLQTVCDMAGRLQLPRTAAVLVALVLAFAVLAMLGAIVADSVHVFAQRADQYAHQLQLLLGRILGWIDYFSCGWTPKGCVNGTSTNSSSPAGAAGSELERLLWNKIPVSQLVLDAVESLLELMSNLFVVFLFTVYLLLGRSERRATEVDRQILAYIKGKVALSSLIGVCTAVILLLVGLDLWLVFGVLAFWLNFVPNVGAVVATLLPMPLVLLDPDMSTAAMVLAFVLPFSVHMITGNVLEPLLFGHSLELHPVVILFALLAWGVLWGLIGVVLSVPITAILKIYLTHIDHPVAAFLVRLLAGERTPNATLPTHNNLEPSAEATVAHGGAGGVGALEAASRPLVTPVGSSAPPAAARPSDAGAT